jgi:hypothetical protein
MTSKYCRLVMTLFVSISMAQADQVEMQNGDRYSGAVLSMTPDTVVFQSEVLGQLKLPRNKVSNISLGSTIAVNRPTTPTNNPAPAAPASSVRSRADASGALRQLSANTNLIEQIRKQFLADAGPQANDKFNELLSGLLTGKLDVDGLRTEAKTAADQLRAMKKDMGGEAGGTLDAYLSVLDNFLSQSAPPAAAPGTNNAQGTIIIREEFCQSFGKRLNCRQV